MMMMITTSEGKKSTLKINKAKFLRRRQGRTSMRKVSSISAGHKLIGAKRNSKATSPFLSAYDAKRQSRWIKPRVFSRARWTPGTPVLRCMRPIRSGTAAITRFLFRIPFYPATFYQLNGMGENSRIEKPGDKGGKRGSKRPLSIQTWFMSESPHGGHGGEKKLLMPPFTMVFSPHLLFPHGGIYHAEDLKTNMKCERGRERGQFSQW